VVNDEGLNVSPGEPGRLLLTTLTNDLMPLVRYEVGDLGAVDAVTPCPCGRASPILREVYGRQDDVIITKDGRRIAIFAFNLLRGLEGVVAMQLIQLAPNSFRVVAKLDGESEEARKNFEAGIRTAFDRLIGVDPDRTMAFEYSEAIERAPGGKIRNVTRAF
jgi:phenylacetate-CoA ligase